MQNIDLICVGKLNAKYFAEGVAENQKRLAAFASFRIIQAAGGKIEEKNASDAVVKRHWTRRARPSCPTCAKVLPSWPCALKASQISYPNELAQFAADRANSGGRETWLSSSARPTACPMR